MIVSSIIVNKLLQVGVKAAQELHQLQCTIPHHTPSIPSSSSGGSSGHAMTGTGERSLGYWMMLAQSYGVQYVVLLNEAELQLELEAGSGSGTGSASGTGSGTGALGVGRDSNIYGCVDELYVKVRCLKDWVGANNTANSNSTTNSNTNSNIKIECEVDTSVAIVELGSYFNTILSNSTMNSNINSIGIGIGVRHSSGELTNLSSNYPSNLSNINNKSNSNTQIVTTANHINHTNAPISITNAASHGLNTNPIPYTMVMVDRITAKSGKNIQKEILREKSACDERIQLFLNNTFSTNSSNSNNNNNNNDNTNGVVVLVSSDASVLDLREFGTLLMKIIANNTMNKNEIALYIDMKAKSNMKKSLKLIISEILKRLKVLIESGVSNVPTSMTSYGVELPLLLYSLIDNKFDFVMVSDILYRVVCQHSTNSWLSSLGLGL